ncbi:probable E3 ubiquitin-protein ligase RHY1A [Benincasa hispida]|uniref:probable E3 ubiquitin-protein ligase RHY1A n=1 Tax=Benincasa hispida TaxID=102211 RepID=UPI00190203B2|nr:probable E3 ubiquitin-protein ligase RHY1A [Benincasa hispida]
MTSASELFYSRRYRLGRTDADLGLDSEPPDRYLQYQRRHHGHNANHRRDFNSCGTFRRSSLQERRQSPRFFNPLSVDRLPTQSDSVTSDGSRNNINPNTQNSLRTGLSGDSRLPGSVLLARERLLERLRGASSPRSRNALVEALDGSPEISTNRSQRISLVDADRMQLVPAPSKRPPGLSQDAIDRLQLEVFINTEHIIDDDVTTTTTSNECSICLESFTDGDVLIHLPCEHKFHHACLDRWIRTCGECPYCRQHVVIN